MLPLCCEFASRLADRPCPACLCPANDASHQPTRHANARRQARSGQSLKQGCTQRARRFCQSSTSVPQAARSTANVPKCLAVGHRDGYLLGKRTIQTHEKSVPCRKKRCTASRPSVAMDTSKPKLCNSFPSNMRLTCGQAITSQQPRSTCSRKHLTAGQSPGKEPYQQVINYERLQLRRGPHRSPTARLWPPARPGWKPNKKGGLGS